MCTWLVKQRPISPDNNTSLSLSESTAQTQPSLTLGWRNSHPGVFFFFFFCDTHFLTSEIQICSGSGGRAASEPGSLPNSVSRSKSFCRSLWWTADGSWFKKRRKDTLVVTRLRRLNYERQFLRSRSSAETFWNIVPREDLWSRESFSQSFRGGQKLVVDFFFTVKSWAWENVIGN